jgi:hypothetical protein
MKKIPIDRIELWKAVEWPVKLKKHFIKKILKSIQPRKKRNALRPLWNQLFDLFNETVYVKSVPECLAPLSLAP